MPKGHGLQVCSTGLVSTIVVNPNPLKFPAHESEFGILDYCGFMKDEAWYLKSVWTDQPVLHIFPHWNLQGHEGEEVTIFAYSNCDEVELLVNGKKQVKSRYQRIGISRGKLSISQVKSWLWVIRMASACW